MDSLKEKITKAVKQVQPDVEVVSSESGSDYITVEFRANKNDGVLYVARPWETTDNDWPEFIGASLIKKSLKSLINTELFRIDVDDIDKGFFIVTVAPSKN